MTTSGRTFQVRAATAMMLAEADDRAEPVSQLIHGEVFTVFEQREGFSRGRCETDAYEGWVYTSALSENVLPVTHRVCVARAPVFPEPDFKTMPLDIISLRSGVRVEETLDSHGKAWARLSCCNCQGFVPLQFLEEISQTQPDLAATALLLLGTPYVWGGRSAFGTDCSGLVQMALLRAGCACPRDTRPMEKAVGRPLSPDTPLQRNDLVFWPGHVGLMADAENIIHANAHHMRVTLEPLAEVSARARVPVSSIRRL